MTIKIKGRTTAAQVTSDFRDSTPAPLLNLLFAAQGLMALIDANVLAMDAEELHIHDCVAALDDFEAAVIKATECMAGGAHHGI